MTRVWDANIIGPAIFHLLGPGTDVDPIEWLADHKHIVLMNDRGDIALFEPGIKDFYSGHYYFKSRGRAAIKAGKEFLDELFNTCYNISILIGFVPLQHLGARWLTRQLGFASQGVVRHNDKPYEMFILTKKDVPAQ